MVARAKAELLEDAGSTTVAVVNGDDALLMSHVRGFRGRLVTFGFDPAATVRATGVTDRGFDGATVASAPPADRSRSRCICQAAPI
jgi:UDP-N-acetylmuramoyl-tripeptide--D-alanyl-D-alanine ligase